MKKSTESSQRKQLKIPLTIFLFLSSFYMLITPGYFTTSMGRTAYLTAVSIYQDGDFALDEPTLETGVGKDGKYYTYEGLAFILITTVVFYGIMLVRIHGGMLLITNQIFTAMACSLLYVCARELKYSKKTSILLSLVYGLATMALVHSRYLMPEPLTTVLYITAFLFLIKYKNRKKSKWLFLCGCANGFLLIVRPEAPLFIAAILVGILILFYRNYREKKKELIKFVKEGLIFLLPLLFFFAGFAYFNYA